jgi:hypothetical protein
MTPKRCARCDEPFSPKRSQQRFCGRSCATKTTAQNRTLVGEANPNWRGGKTAHPLYEVYLDMIGRCVRPSHHAYDRYGGRGIRVCARWLDNFWAFAADVGERPEGRSIDRVDNDGDYTPENFRWATRSQQSLNRRRHGYETRSRNEKGQFV